MVGAREFLMRDFAAYPTFGLGEKSVIPLPNPNPSACRKALSHRNLDVKIGGARPTTMSHKNIL